MRRTRHFLALAAVTLLLGPAAAAQVPTVPAILREMPDERVFHGRIEAVRQATVAAETSGRIEEIRADIGDFIAAGTVILTVTSAEQRAGLTQAEAALAEARSTLEAETAEYDRVVALQARELIAKAELDRATARLNVASARVDSAEAALRTARERLSYTEVKAPYAGVVSARHVEPGEAVQPGTLLMSGYDPAELRVEVDLPQVVADQVRAIGEARILPADGSATGEAVPDIVPARLVLYPVADAATSTVRVRLELPADAGGALRPGQFVRALFTVGSVQRLLVPAASVVYRSEVAAVYVVRDGAIRLRQIRPGVRVGDQVEVLAGLAAGEAVAADPVAAAQALAGAAAGSPE